MQYEKSELFATPVYFFGNPAATVDHAAWREALYELRARDPGRTVSNQLGWQGGLDFSAMPRLAGLGRFILACTEQVTRAEGWQLSGRRLLIDAWANINGKGASNLLHNHPASYLSGCYYIDTPAGGGELLLRDPREAANFYRPPYADPMRNSALRSITPVPGLLLLFPPWLLHGVAVNLSEGDRLSVAFNVNLDAPQGHGTANALPR